MNYLDKVIIKSYYKFWNMLLPKKLLLIPESLEPSRNIFLYFDYEREFGGHNTSIKDSDIKYIINLLNELSLKTTWFTVGQIFSKYPDTINAIIRGGHELASHTFYHVPPLNVKVSNLVEDFKKTKAEAPVPVMGFHSPNSRWTVLTLKYLNKFGYKYDVVRVPKENSFIPFVNLVPGFGKTIRLHTVGDDWSLYQKNKTGEEVLDHFIKLVEKIGLGEIGGIGIHPWILFSDHRIMEGFKMFLKFLKEQPDLNVDTAIGYAECLNREK